MSGLQWGGTTYAVSLSPYTSIHSATIHSFMIPPRFLNVLVLITSSGAKGALSRCL
ncbi:hypothetical protein BDV29DRAFT_61695 [Aspergillus leporis]|uniref:Uncharacterized protein n=1 Tax=Aspergillus leporis TaxID=41062 RepID=A0A5N5XDN7_9EURO|nr:hypothetical protein BDV29DRAFT_61695 [Aspergillus leporis]